MMTTTSTYGEYGTRQAEFGYLAEASQAEVVGYCHTIALMMNDARDLLADSTVVTVTTAGLVITRGDVRREVARTVERPTASASAQLGAHFPGWHGLTELGG